MKKHFSTNGRVGFIQPEIDNYAATMSTPESPLRVALALETLQIFPDEAVMMIGRQEAALIQLLLRLSGSRHVLEFGAFTGYSAIAMKEVLPPDGSVWTFESDPAHAEIAERYIKMANAEGGAHIVLRVKDGHTLPFPSDPPDIGLPGYPLFDAAFIDAEKEGYQHYWELAKAHVGSGGLIIADNTLSNLRKEESDSSGKAIQEFNRMVHNDPEVDAVLITVRDGMTITYVK